MHGAKARRRVKMSKSVLRKFGWIAGWSKGFLEAKVIFPPSSSNLSEGAVKEHQNDSRAEGEMRLVNMVKKWLPDGASPIKDMKSSWNQAFI